MYKKMQKPIYILIILITLCIAVILVNPIEKKLVFEEAIFKTQKFNKVLFKENQLKTALQQVYFSNQVPKHFNSAGVTLPLPKLYDMYWGLNIINQGYLEKKDMEYISLMKSPEYISLLKQSFIDSSFPYLLKQFYLTGIYNYLSYSNYDKISLSKEINQYYDKNKSLYFLKDINESETDKLSATLTAIRIHKNMGIELKYKEQIKKKSIDLYNAFSTDKLNKSIIEKFNYMSAVISILSELGENYESLKDTLNYKDNWLESEEISKLMDKSNPLIILYAKKLLDVNHFYGKMIRFDKETLDIMTSRSFLNDTTDGNNEVVFEPSLLSYDLELYKNNNYRFPFQTELESYLKKSIDSKFNKTGYTQVSLEDNFYGISIANLINFPYEKDIQIDFLKTSFTALFEDDTNILSNDKLKNIYYLLLSFKIMQIEIPDQSIISTSVTNYLLSLKKEKENFQINFEAYDLGLRILTLLEQKVPQNLKSIVAGFINEFTQDDLMLNSGIDYQYKMFSIICNANLNKNKILNNILDNIEELKDSNGYKSTYKSVSADIFSTYKAYAIKKSIKTLDTASLQDIQSFLSSDISFNDYLGYTTIYENMNLKTIFYSIILSGFH